VLGKDLDWANLNNQISEGNKPLSDKMSDTNEDKTDDTRQRVKFENYIRSS
jgi:hypothetical protein